MSPVPNAQKLAKSGSQTSLGKATSQSKEMRDALRGRGSRASSGASSPLRMLTRSRSLNTPTKPKETSHPAVSSGETGEEVQGLQNSSVPTQQGSESPVEAGIRAGYESLVDSLKSRIVDLSKELVDQREDAQRSIEDLHMANVATQKELVRLTQSIAALQTAVVTLEKSHASIPNNISVLQQGHELHSCQLQALSVKISKVETHRDAMPTPREIKYSATPAKVPSAPPSPVPYPSSPSANSGKDGEATLHLPGKSEKYEDIGASPLLSRTAFEDRVGVQTPRPILAPPRGAGLVTTAASPDYIIDLPSLERPAPTLGPYAPGLHPLKTMVKGFSTLVDYRAYRLRNTSAEMTPAEVRKLSETRKRIDTRYPNLYRYSGDDGIASLSFLTDMVDAMNSFGASEGAAVHLLGHYLTGQAKALYESHVRPGKVTAADRLRATWPFVIHDLLDRFIDDDLLVDEMKTITYAQQKDTEVVDEYAARIENAADRCRHVFTQQKLVHNFILGLSPDIRALVQVSLGETDPGSLTLLSVKRTANRCSKTTSQWRTATKPGVPVKPRIPVRRKAATSHHISGFPLTVPSTTTVPPTSEPSIP